jgi:NADH-quinone oxidoreductase subunit L
MNAAYVILALPLVGFGLLLVGGKRIGDPGAGWLATTMVGGSFVATVVVFLSLLSRAEDSRTVIKSLWDWIGVGGFDVKFALQIDPLSITMALFVTGVGTLIHLYSVGYMKGDPRYHQFFVYLNLFAFSMLCLVLADNFVFMFLGWEGVGACSYFLVSFWFERSTAATAGKKAFVTNRVGDFGLMLAMFLVFQHLGVLDYVNVFGHVDNLSQYTATAIALLFFLGAVGKSAQLPLFVWLPDAMEGPTPVSALIHAATMVTAGVYLMARIGPILHLAPDALTVVAIVGAATALFAATVACAQDDIKKVLAYSTISQLGYMFLGIGSGAYVAGLFHMITHAFFKALLFLGAGSVIHGLHNEQNMKKMGALRRWMPVTGTTFLIGWLAISGIPPFAGFWSKDDILAGAWHKSPALWAVGAFTAGLTAYYMSRQVYLVFFGQPRFDEAEVHPHESPWTMALPLGVLAALSVVGGLINIPFRNWDYLSRWLRPVLNETVAPELHVATNTKWALFAVTTTLCLLGIAAGLRLWSRSADQPRLEPEPLRRAWYLDYALSAVIGGPGRELADAAAFSVDKGIIDGAVNGVATIFSKGGEQLRKVQTGYVRNYALGLAAGTAVILGYVSFLVLRSVG